MKKIVILFLLIVTTPLLSQETEVIQEKKEKGNKGKMFVIWGWNRGFFSNSDIHFKGNDYDFVLSNVEGNDRITPFSIEYFSPSLVTIPQTNMRIGYFFHDHFNVSIGVDHMKYVMKNYQTVQIDGTIANGTVYNGIYNNEDIVLTHEFLTFEHTDGLNYINVEIDRFDSLNDLLNFKTGFMEVNLTEGIGGGIIYPKTNTTLMGSERYDEFNVAGYGLSAKVGLNLTFFDHLFFQSDFKVGYINMNNIRTTISESDSATQDFTFTEATFLIGYKFQLIKQK